MQFKKKPLQIFNGGEMSRDFIYIDDVIECILGLIEKPAKPNLSFNYFSPTHLLVGHLIEYSTLGIIHQLN